MTPQIDFDKLVASSEIAGEDEAETQELRELLREARQYLLDFAWVKSIKSAYFGFGFGDVLGIFLFEIEPASNADSWLWVVCGDLPTAYLVVDAAPNASAALEIYCEMMRDWVSAVRAQGDLRQVFPVAAEPSLQNAELLERRIEFLTKEVLPVCQGRE